MALNIELTPSGPGVALLEVAGVEAIPERIALALQRNDGHWLGVDRQWQDTPHWHPMFTAEAAPDGIQLLLGADLVDCIIGVGGSPLQVTMRLDDATDAGVLRIRGALIGSGARAQVHPDDGDTVILRPIPRPAPEADAPQAPSDDRIDVATTPEGPLSTTEATSRSPRWPWIALVVVLVLAAVGAGLWWFGLADPLEPPVVASPPESATSLRETEPPTTPEPSIAPDATGATLARAFLAGNPDLEAVFTRGEKAEQDGDCAAAFALYSEAANRDPGLAARLARRYDPRTHTAGPCISKPDAPYAIIYFKDAAEVGDTAAQRRLGQLMVERESAGPTHEAGLQWLRRAAQAGDEEATRILDGLAEP